MTRPERFKAPQTKTHGIKAMKASIRIVTITTIALAAALMMVAQTPQVAALLARARAQEQAGRVDLAVQTWQQVLLVDTRDTEAIAGMARASKLADNDAQAKAYLDRLRQIDPGNAAIAKIEATSSTKVQNAQLSKAASLAQAGHTEEALKIYRGVWGNRPPDGDWALAYYDTEASTEAGRQDAITGLRALAAKFPADLRYSVTLGRILTYSPKTRSDGLRLLGMFPHDPAALEAARQAHLWDAQDPHEATAVRAYLKEHPDQQIAQSLEDAQQRQAQSKLGDPGIPQTAAERQAFASLSADKVEEAQEQFLAIQAGQPDNPRVFAGLGFLRMKQNHFSEAVGLLELAEKNGLRRRDVEEALQTARFLACMQRGTEALETNHSSEAAQAYKAALLLRPNSIDALNGLAGAYVKAVDLVEASGVYRQIVKLQPKSLEAWRGLFSAQVQASQPADALETSRRLPPSVRTELQRDPAFLRGLASAYTANGQEAQAKSTLDQGLALPFPDNGRGLPLETRLQYAGLLVDARRYAQAAGLYREILNDNPDALPAWQGLIAMQHQAGHDPEAIATVERMAPSLYDAALEDTGFLEMMAGIYQQQNRFALAQTLLQRAVAAYASKGQAVPLGLELQMASIWLQQNRPAQAYAMYQTVLRAHPEKTDAWKGLISALHQTHHDRDALAELKLIPMKVLRELDRDIAYQQIVAGVYASTGNEQAALQLIAQIQSHYRALHGVAPVDIDIQDAWLLYNTHDDRDLYRALMSLGGRDDLADEQRRTVQTIWAAWSVRRAGEASDAGNAKRAVEILAVAYQAFPDNPDVIKALAGGYLKAGDPKRAMTIFANLHLANPLPADYQSMISAALAAPDLRQAELWLREALDKFANDPQVLALAARFEQARGDHTRAAAYWKRSLAAMPAEDPTNRLAHTLDRADAGPVRRGQDASLSSLLDPDNASRNQRPALPSYGDTYASADRQAATAPAGSLYGPDPYLTGTAPVQIDRHGELANTPMGRPGSAAAGRLGDFDPAADQDPAQASIDLVPPSPAAATTSNDAFAPPVVQNSSGRHEIPSEELRTERVLTHRTLTIPQASIQSEPSEPVGSVPLEMSVQPNASIHLLTTNQANLTSSTPAYIVPQAALPAAFLQQRAAGPLTFPSAPPADPPAVPTQAAAPQPQYGVTDVQLQQQNLPPLRGSWDTRPLAQETDPRTIEEQQLAIINAGFSAWRGGTGYVSHRSGTAGFDQLTILEAPFETSGTVGGSARVTAMILPSVLDSGQADGTGTYGLGTSAVGSKPAQQNSAGVGGEVQLSTSNIGLSAGTTPRGFLVANFTGRLSVHPASGPLTLNFVRDGVKDSQLSYAGLRDPATVTSTFAGNTWGGVVSNAGNMQYSRGDDMSGYYVGFGGQYITGLNVETNNRVDGVAGAYWKVLKVPGTGDLTIGANFFGMHYAHNLRFFTYGQGGYFSPSVYFLANVPFTMNGQYGNSLHYTIAGAFGLQAFQEDSSLYYPTHVYTTTTTTAPVTVTDPIASVARPSLGRPVLPIFPVNPVTPAFNNPSYPSQSVVGGNYDLHAEIADHVIDRWYIGGFLNLNNTRDYASQTVGFFVRYMTRPQDVTEGGPTGLFPYQGFRPLLVP